MRRNWYLLKVEPGLEVAVSKRLASMGFEVFVPMGRRQRHWGGGRLTSAAAFDGVVYIKSDANWKPLRGLSGVIGFEADPPVPVSATVVHQLMLAMSGRTAIVDTDLLP